MGSIVSASVLSSTLNREVHKCITSLFIFLARKLRISNICCFLLILLHYFMKNRNRNRKGQLPTNLRKTNKQNPLILLYIRIIAAPFSLTQATCSHSCCLKIVLEVQNQYFQMITVSPFQSYPVVFQYLSLVSP